jgi:hypothetical protein
LPENDNLRMRKCNIFIKNEDSSKIAAFNIMKAVAKKYE